MATFGFLEIESVVQVNDRTRLSAVKSFAPKGSSPITLVRIRPEASAPWVTVSGVNLTQKDWFLDWQYDTAGTKTVELEITPDTEAPQVFSKSLLVLTEAEDRLFSTDQDLISKEADVLRWVPQGKNSFLYVHREAQRQILNWLDEMRVYKNDGSRIEKTDLPLSDDLKQLSVDWALALIFGSISNKPDDAFFQKKQDYLSLVESHKRRGRIIADFNGNGTIEQDDNQDLRTFRMVRR
jgi:hypothetical protein